MDVNNQIHDLVQLLQGKVTLAFNVWFMCLRDERTVVRKGEITEEKDVMSETSVIFTKLYMCLRDNQGVVLKAEITEEKENVMSETSVIFNKLCFSGMTKEWCEKGKLPKKMKMLCPKRRLFLLNYICLRDDQGVVRTGEITEEDMSETSVIFTKPYMCLRDGQGVVRKAEITEEKKYVMSETSVIFTKP